MKASTIIKNIAVLGSIFMLSFCATFAPAEQFDPNKTYVYRDYARLSLPFKRVQPQCIEPASELLQWLKDKGFKKHLSGPPNPLGIHRMTVKHPELGNEFWLEAITTDVVCIHGIGNPEFEAPIQN